MQRLRRALEPLIRRLMHFYWRFARATTLGARAMVIDGTGRIFLVKHSYVDGWHLPGGAVSRILPSSASSRASAARIVSPVSTPPPGRCQPST